MQHQSRFKSYLIPPEKLKNESVELRPLLLALDEFNGLSPAEKVFLFIVLYLQKRCPDQWWIKKRKIDFKGSCLRLQDLGESFSFLKRPGCETLGDWLSQYDFKKIPGGILSAVRGWMQGSHQLLLELDPITPYQMLDLQSQGRRVVTLSLGKAMQGELVDGRRDSFEFLLHDLIHADLMFVDPHMLSAQIDFFKSLKKIFDQGLLHEELLRDIEFKTSFEYLISDMNSHPLHMAHLLKASYIHHLRILGRNISYIDGLREMQRVGNFDPDLTDLPVPP